MIENISFLKECYQNWLNSISKLNDFDLIQEIKNGSKCIIEQTIPIINAFNYNSNWVSVNVKLPNKKGYTWYITITSSR